MDNRVSPWARRFVDVEPEKNVTPRKPKWALRAEIDAWHAEATVQCRIHKRRAVTNAVRGFALFLLTQIPFHAPWASGLRWLAFFIAAVLLAMAMASWKRALGYRVITQTDLERE
jgi:hypothetical protein